MDRADHLGQPVISVTVAIAGLEHHPVAAPHLFGRRDNDAVALAVKRLHRIALHFQGIDAAFARRGQGDLVPALAGGKAGAVEEAARTRLSQAQQRHRAAGVVVVHLQERPRAGEERIKTLPRGFEDFGNALGRGPALPAVLADALGDIEGGGVEAGKLGERGNGMAVALRQRIDSIPDGSV